MASPVVGHVRQHHTESNERCDVGNASTRGISDSTLDWREDCASTDTHNKNAGSTTGMSAQVGSAEREDGWVHWGFEEE